MLDDTLINTYFTSHQHQTNAIFWYSEDYSPRKFFVFFTAQIIQEISPVVFSITVIFYVYRIKHNDARKNICGNTAALRSSLSRVKELVQLALWVEFYTIPPYLTAYLSIKPQSALKVKKMLKR